MKYVSVPVYKYSELSERSQIKAQEDWVNSDPTEYLIREFRDFITELEHVGISLQSWEIDEWGYQYQFNTNSGLIKFNIEGLSALKKALSVYYKLNLVPKIYKSKTKQRVSKFQQVINNDHLWIRLEFVEALKEHIQHKSLEYNLIDYLEEALDLTIHKIHEKYIAILDSLPTVAEDYNNYFFEDGSLYYESPEVENE